MNASTSLVQALKQDGVTVEIRTSDGFVNATKMAQSAGKEWKNYFKSDNTRSFLAQLSRSLSVSTVPGGADPSAHGTDPIGSGSVSQALYSKVVCSIMNGCNGSRGTWVHPQVAIDFARWISPKFAVAVTDIIFRYATGKVTTSESQNAAQDLGLNPAISKDAWEEHNWILMTYGKDRGVYAGSFDDGGKMKVGRVDKNLADRVKSHVKEYANFALFAFMPSTNPYASERAILDDPEMAQHQLEYDGQKEIFDMSPGALTKSRVKTIYRGHQLALEAGSSRTGATDNDVVVAKETTRQAEETTRQAEAKTKQLQLEFQIEQLRSVRRCEIPPQSLLEPPQVTLPPDATQPNTDLLAEPVQQVTEETSVLKVKSGSSKDGNEDTAPIDMERIQGSTSNVTEQEAPASDDVCMAPRQNSKAALAVQMFISERLDLTRPDKECVAYADVVNCYLKWRTFHTELLADEFGNRTALSSGLRDRKRTRAMTVGNPVLVVCGASWKDNVEWPEPSLPRCPEAQYITMHLARSGNWDNTLLWGVVWDKYVEWRKKKDATYSETPKDRLKLRDVLRKAAFIVLENGRNKINFAEFKKVEEDDAELVAEETISLPPPDLGFVVRYLDEWMVQTQRQGDTLYFPNISNHFLLWTQYHWQEIHPHNSIACTTFLKRVMEQRGLISLGKNDRVANLTVPGVKWNAQAHWPLIQLPAGPENNYIKLRLEHVPCRRTIIKWSKLQEDFTEWMQSRNRTFVFNKSKRARLQEALQQACYHLFKSEENVMVVRFAQFHRQQHE